MRDELKNIKTNELHKVLGQENFKVTCVERKYKVSNSKIGFFVTAKKELDENTTQELLHEDMELKTFLANYEITDVAPTLPPQEAADISEKSDSVRKDSTENTVEKKNIGSPKIDNKLVEKDGSQKRMKSEAMKRMDLFDSLNLQETFLIKDYKKALEEIGIKTTNTAMPYDDLERLEKRGKITRIGIGEHGTVSFLKKRKEEAIVMQ
jgi:hypothetical protein